MDVAVVYESMFGNTHEIAEAIADGVRAAGPGGRVTALRVTEATPSEISRAGLIIVGGPTHLRGMTTERTRRKGIAAAPRLVWDWEPGRTAEETPKGPGVREWLAGMLPPRPGSLGAAFDTRDGYQLAGGAAHRIARSLQAQGYELVAKPEGFIVWGTGGPLRLGERARAQKWGTGVARSAQARLADLQTQGP
jgi:Flavodoxin